MFLGFIRQKTIAAKPEKDMRGLEEKLAQTWNLADEAVFEGYGLEDRAKRVMTRMFGHLHQTMTAILKTVVALASLGPDLFRISGTFKDEARTQKERANEISGAGQRISTGIHEISSRTDILSTEFAGIEKEVTQALEKGDQSMSGFGEIKNQVAVLVETIQALKEQSDSIGSIIDVINNISDETNILSLNARIEAARGQADGKGFKVIAEEVGNLARQSKEATLGIRDRLTFLGDKIRQTVDAVEQVDRNILTCEAQINDANAALNTVCSQFSGLAGNLSEINEAAASQAEDVRQVSANIQEIESALAGQVRDADTLFGMAENVNTACDEMILSTGVFHISGHQRAGQAAEMMAADSGILSGRREEREKTLARYLDRETFIELAYVTDAGGCQVTSNIYSPALKTRDDLSQGFNEDWSGKEWFRKPMETGQTFVSNVYRSSATRSFCFTVAVPLLGENGFSGVLGIDVNFRDMLNI